jgi:hypothetical protein
MSTKGIIIGGAIAVVVVAVVIHLRTKAVPAGRSIFTGRLTKKAIADVVARPTARRGARHF